MTFAYEPIGILHGPVTDPRQLPAFHTISKLSGVIEIYPAYQEGLLGLAVGDRISVIFHFHLSQGYELHQRRRGLGPLRGVFSLCSPNRPNPIGLSVVTITAIAGGNLTVEHVDMADGTPILDIKPYKPA